ncbi:DUF4355 domain-containing protein [Oceanobacillus oncorhynchi]|uniref:DUF4355 domain-containing protein n=1 Tax=Oceanobacillus oncorhynchi TaxID=545501 RepID=UPI0025A3580A|nr:DUF4355 domain-containing protein [Oceanobacillus oncorhynchi]MDM8100942.1 DUF4355 domain-containing protein [Oceanobacillus oncorhynchi]
MNELMDKVKKLAIETPFTKGQIASSLAHRAQQGLPLDLQFFAEPGEGTGQGEGGGQEPEDKSANQQGEDTFTKAEVDSQVSKAVDKALKNREEKHQEEIQKAIDDAIAEKERLSKLSEKERQQEELTQREKKILEREEEIKRAQLRSDAVADLQEKKLPSDFADFLLGDDAEITLENINSFKKAFDEAVNAQVKVALRQETPPSGSGAVAKSRAQSVSQIAQEHRLIK